ncbi:unannotated protein [freshwater metagenome]|uniref:Unannotated protein n=1 Tax=freshwater metagenome TaxID=449393 RepID=A0A6J6C6N9_9ZZZZ
MQGLEHGNELVAEAVLERHPVTVNPPGNKKYLFVFNIDALNITDPLWEPKDLGLRKRRSREPATVTFPDHWRVQALFNHCPN